MRIDPVKTGILLSGAVLALAVLACSNREGTDEAVDHFALGRLLYEDRLYERACDEIKRTVMDDPHQVEAHTLLGFALLKRGRSEEAIEHLEVPAAADTKDPQVYIELAKLYQKTGNYDQALACALKANKLAPNNAYLSNLLGRVYFDKGSYDEAIQAYERVLQREDKAWVRNNLGLLYIHNLKWEKAREHLTKAVYLDPNNAKARNNLGVAYQSLGDLRKAMRQYAEAVRLDPGYAKAAQNLEKAKQKLGAQPANPAPQP